jgi:hypothetical protein
MKAYGRHAPAADEIYCTMMAERTGEAPDNYRARPFDMELLFYAPSAPEETPPHFIWPFPPAAITQQFGDDQPHGHTGGS